MGPTIEDALQVSVVPLADGAGRVEYRLTNLGDLTLRLLPRETALIDATNAFEVLLDDKPAGYMGDQVYWAPPKEESLVELAPGATLSRTIDLTALYDMGKVGSYTVRARALAGTTLGTQTGALSWAAPAAGGESPPVVVSVDAEHLPAPDSEDDTVEKATFPANSGCQAPFVQGVISVDEQRAKQYLNAIANQRSNILNNPTPKATQLLQTHFAPSNAASRQYIFDMYGRINTNISSTGYFCRSETHVDCAPPFHEAYARTTKSSSQVRLCPLYFEVVGTTRSRILIHEASHQNRNSTIGTGTDDLFNTPSIHNAYMYESYSMKCFEGTCY